MSSIVEDWDVEIKPRNALFDLKLKDVWHYRDLMWLFVRRDFVAQYKQTVLGPLWHFIQPLLTSLMFLVVFGKIARIPTDGVDPLVFYMAGNVIWGYFSSCLNATSNTFVGNASIFGKVYFPRLVIPISVVISTMIKFGIQFLLLLATMIYSSVTRGVPFYISWTWCFIPLIVLVMAGIGLGLGIIVSALTAKYRDFTVLIGFAIQLWMYITPIVYPLSFLEGSKYAVFVKANPLSSVVEAFKYCVIGQGEITYNGLLYSVIFMITSLLIGCLVFTKVEKTFMDTV
jgi:lipopolysaccharide transport system permease protein